MKLEDFNKAQEIYVGISNIKNSIAELKEGEFMLYINLDLNIVGTKQRFKEIKKTLGIDELRIYPAKRETGVDYFYCKKFNTVGMVGESCGGICSSYKPNNGKNGRCFHYGWCYEPTGKEIIV